jgi:hypothetical protein
MLEPDGRAALTEQLRPPVGFELVHAVGTTFTLDLTSALSVPLSFASSQVRESTDPVAILDAVRRAAERIDIFAQAGQITVPAQASDLVAFLEPMTHPVRARRRGALFHPKVWVLEYAQGGERAYRLLCGSRNLTNDRSWDLVVRLDGVGSGGDRAENAPLRDLLLALPELSVLDFDSARHRRIEDLAQRILAVRWNPPPDVNQSIFHALGVGRSLAEDLFVGKRHLVVSPFLSDQGVATVTARAREKPIVISRPESFDHLQPGTLAGIATYVLDETTRDPDAKPDDPLVGLHAKAYGLDRQSGSRLYIGSANATEAAFSGNVEFIVELIGPQPRMGVAALFGDGGLGPLVTPYSTGGGVPESENDKADRLLEEAVRMLGGTRLRALVLSMDDGPHAIDVEQLDDVRPPEGFIAEVQLITRPGNARPFPEPRRGVSTFEGLTVTDITPFIVVRVTDGRGEQATTVTRAELVGDIEGRHDAVLARQLDTPEKFLKFLLLLLALSGADARAAMKVGGSEFGEWTFGGAAGTFESLVGALASNPEALDDLARIIDRMRETPSWAQIRETMTDFDELWDAIWLARRAQGARR